MKSARLLFSALALVCAASVQAGNRPFPQNVVYAGPDLYPWLKPNHAAANTLAKRAAAVQERYQQWKLDYVRTYVRPDGMQYTVIRSPERSVPGWGAVKSISGARELGYGMLLAAYMDDRELFQRLWSVYRDFKARPCVLPDPQTPVVQQCVLVSQDIPSDLDTRKGTTSRVAPNMDIGLALLLADMQWGSDLTYTYKVSALGIAQRLVQDGGANIYEDFFATALGEAGRAVPETTPYLESTHQVDVNRDGDRNDQLFRLYRKFTYTGDWSMVMFPALQKQLYDFALMRIRTGPQGAYRNFYADWFAHHQYEAMINLHRAYKALSSKPWPALLPDHVARANYVGNDGTTAHLAEPTTPTAEYPKTSVRAIPSPNKVFGLPGELSNYSHDGKARLPMHLVWQQLNRPIPPMHPWVQDIGRFAKEQAVIPDGASPRNFSWWRIPYSYRHDGTPTNWTHSPTNAVNFLLAAMSLPASEPENQRAINAGWDYLRWNRVGPTDADGWFHDSVSLLGLLTLGHMLWMPSPYDDESSPPPPGSEHDYSDLPTWEPLDAQP